MNPNIQKLAIDIVLPPIDVMDKIIAINRQAADKNAAWLQLAKDDFIPHLSLAISGVRKDSIEKVKSTVKDIAKKLSPLPMELSELYYVQKPNGSKIYGIRAINISELQQLHESLMHGLKQYFSYDCTKDSLFSKPGEQVAQPDYINGFVAKNSFGAFDPHITIHTKEAVGQELLPLKFKATEIAACHVGQMTTCRKKLFSVEVEDK